jgi:hypothetical protein
VSAAKNNFALAKSGSGVGAERQGFESAHRIETRKRHHISRDCPK